MKTTFHFCTRLNTWLALWCGLALLSFTGPLAAATVGDNFDDNSVDPAKWGPDEKFGHGVLTEKNQRLEYTCSNGTSDDDLIRRWRAGNGPYNADWEMQIDLFNNASFTPGSVDQNNSFGIKLRGPTDDGQEIFVELYNSQFTGGDPRKGFDAEFETPGVPDVDVDAGISVPGNAGAVRMTFDSVLKVVTVYWATNNHDWVQFASFGVEGSFGTEGNDDWGMSTNDQFRIYLYGFSTKMNVTSGQIYGDNFQTTGLVGPGIVHDLAVTKITAPKTVTLDAKHQSVIKRVGVAIQNRSAHAETITNLDNLVTLTVETLNTNCNNPFPVLHVGAPQKKLPFTLKSKAKMTVFFDVTFECANDPAKGKGHEDYRYIARAHHEAIDGEADTHPECDVCPRGPLAGGVDPNPNGKIKDKGCGTKLPNGLLGGDVLTDVVVK